MSRSVNLKTFTNSQPFAIKLENISLFTNAIVTTNVSHSISEQLLEQNTITHSIENELEFMLSKYYFYSPLFSYEGYKMLLKTALSNALYVKHLTYFLELAAAEYTTETAEGLKI